MHAVKRRAFLGTAGTLLTGPLAVEAQQAARIFRIGYLSDADPAVGRGHPRRIQASTRCAIAAGSRARNVVID
jgi:hypothetical protein